MGKKKVVLRPFHEVAFETLEGGKKTEAYRLFEECTGGFSGEYVPIVVAFLLTRCVVPEKEQSRIVPALIAASKKVMDDPYGDLSAVIAFALTHFHPGKKGLKELGKLLSAEYLRCEDSEEVASLKNLLERLELEVPERPKKEEAKKPAPKKPKPKKPLTK